MLMVCYVLVMISMQGRVGHEPVMRRVAEDSSTDVQTTSMGCEFHFRAHCSVQSSNEFEFITESGNSMSSASPLRVCLVDRVDAECSGAVQSAAVRRRATCGVRMEWCVCFSRTCFLFGSTSSFCLYCWVFSNLLREVRHTME